MKTLTKVIESMLSQDASRSWNVQAPPPAGPTATWGWGGYASTWGWGGVSGDSANLA